MAFGFILPLFTLGIPSNTQISLSRYYNRQRRREGGSTELPFSAVFVFVRTGAEHTRSAAEEKQADLKNSWTLLSTFASAPPWI
jgi:hypothetical protein